MKNKDKGQKWCQIILKIRECIELLEKEDMYVDDKTIEMISELRKLWWHKQRGVDLS